MRIAHVALALLLSAQVQAQAQVTAPAPPQVLAAPENPSLIGHAGDSGSMDGFELSPDGKTIALFGVDWGDPNKPDSKRAGKIQLWDVNSRAFKVDLAGHVDAVQHVLWSRDGSRLVSQSQDGMVALWDAQSGKLLRTLSPGGAQFKGFDKSTPEENFKMMVSSAERATLLGFSLDGSQVLAIAGKVELPQAPPKDQNGKPKSIDFYSMVQPLLKVWDVGSGREVRSTPFGKRGDFGNIFVPGGRLLADGKSFLVIHRDISQGKILAARIEMRDLDSGALIGQLSPAEPLNDITEISQDGSLALAVDGTTPEGRAKGNRAQFWDVTSQKPMQVLEDASVNFRRAYFSRDNTKILASVRGGSMAIFDVATGKRERLIPTSHFNEVNAAALTPDGKYLLSVGQVGREVQRWDLTASTAGIVAPRALIEAFNTRGVFFAPDGSLWCGNGEDDWNHNTDLRSGKSLRLFHAGLDGKMIDEISIPEKLLADHVIFSRDFSLAAAALGSQPQPAYLQGEGIGVWDIKNRKRLWQLGQGPMYTQALAIAPNNKTVVAGSEGTKVQEWNLKTGKLARTLFQSKMQVQSLAFAPGGKYLAIGFEGGTIILLSMPDGRKVAQMDSEPSVRGLAFSDDGKYLASGGTLEVANEPVGVSANVWDVESHESVAEFSIAKRLFGGLAFSPDGKRLALSHFKSYDRRDDGQVGIYEVDSQRVLQNLRDRTGAEHPAFSPDGQSLVTINGRWVKAWDLAVGEAAQP